MPKDRGNLSPYLSCTFSEHLNQGKTKFDRTGKVVAFPTHLRVLLHPQIPIFCVRNCMGKNSKYLVGTQGRVPRIPLTLANYLQVWVHPMGYHYVEGFRDSEMSSPSFIPSSMWLLFCIQTDKHQKQ